MRRPACLPVRASWRQPAQARCTSSLEKIELEVCYDPLPVKTFYGLTNSSPTSATTILQCWRRAKHRQPSRHGASVSVHAEKNMAKPHPWPFSTGQRLTGAKGSKCPGQVLPRAADNFCARSRWVVKLLANISSGASRTLAAGRRRKYCQQRCFSSADIFAGWGLCSIARVSIVLIFLSSLNAWSPAWSQEEARSPGGIPFLYDFRFDTPETSVSIGWRYSGLAQLQDSQLGWIVAILPTLGSVAVDGPLLDKALVSKGVRFYPRDAQPGIVGGVITFRTEAAADVSRALAAVLRAPSVDAEFARIAVQHLRDASRTSLLDHGLGAQLSHDRSTFSTSGYRTRQESMLATQIEPDGPLFTEVRKSVLASDRILLAVSGSISLDHAKTFIDTSFTNNPSSSREEERSHPNSESYKRRVIHLVRDVPRTKVFIFITISTPLPATNSASAEIVLWKFALSKDSVLRHFFRAKFGAEGQNIPVVVQEIPISPMHSIVSISTECPVGEWSNIAHELVQIYDEYLSSSEAFKDKDLSVAKSNLAARARTNLTGIRAEALLRSMATGWRGISLRDIAYYDVVTLGDTKSIMQSAKMNNISIVVVAPDSASLRTDCKVGSVIEAEKCLR